MEKAVEDVMARDVAVTDRESSLISAAKAMKERGVGALVVVEGDKPVGIITERDYLRKTLEKGTMDIKVEEAMSAPVVSVHATTLLSEALEVMSEKGIRHLPVTDGGRLVGIVTARDIFPRYVDSLLESFNKIYSILETIR
ncbi:MAG: CBS domain-containing protein [Euryarchaeota archaeon]|nr:CBS domain-containing protein [Euryarchaeota archaeon]